MNHKRQNLMFNKVVYIAGIALTLGACSKSQVSSSTESKTGLDSSQNGSESASLNLPASIDLSVSEVYGYRENAVAFNDLKNPLVKKIYRAVAAVGVQTLVPEPPRPTLTPIVGSVGTVSGIQSIDSSGVSTSGLNVQPYSGSTAGIQPAGSTTVGSHPISIGTSTNITPHILSGAIPVPVSTLPSGAIPVDPHISIGGGTLANLPVSVQSHPSPNGILSAIHDSSVVSIESELSAALGGDAVRDEVMARLPSDVQIQNIPVNVSVIGKLSSISIKLKDLFIAQEQNFATHLAIARSGRLSSKFRMSQLPSVMGFFEAKNGQTLLMNGQSRLLKLMDPQGGVSNFHNMVSLPGNSVVMMFLSASQKTAFGSSVASAIADQDVVVATKQAGVVQSISVLRVQLQNPVPVCIDAAQCSAFSGLL